MRAWVLSGAAMFCGSSALAQEAVKAAPCCGGKMSLVFLDAAPEMKLVIGGLWIAAVAVVVAWVLARRRSTPGPGWLHGLQVGGPLLGFAGTAYVLANGMVALAFVRPPQALFVMAPGLAEAATSAWAGLLAGALAAFASADLKRAAQP